MDENELIKGCLKNSRESQKALYDYYYNKMFGVCLRYSKDSDEAKEIIQEGFLNVFSNIKHLKGGDSLESWIKNIIVQTTIGHLGKNKQNLIVSTVYANSTTVNHAENLSDREIILNIDKERLLKAVQQLTPAYRKVFNLFVIEGYNHKTIAEMLDISEETSEISLAKAKFNLRKNIMQLSKQTNG